MTNMELIPNNWKYVRVEEISMKIHYGYTASALKKDTGTRILRITDIQNRRVKWDTVPFCVISESDKSKFLLKENDLVFARTGATVGKSFLVSGQIPEAVFASYLIRIKISKLINPKYLYYFFQSPDYWKQIGKKSVGIGQPNVNAKSLSNIILPLAPLNEQDLIVNKIEEYLSSIEQNMAQVSKSKSQLNTLRKNFLKSALEGELTKAWRQKKENNISSKDLIVMLKTNLNIINDSKIDIGLNVKFKRKEFVLSSQESTSRSNSEIPKEWIRILLSDLSEKITDGTHHTPEYKKQGIHFISVKDIYDGKVHFDNTRFIDEETHLELSKRCNPEPGDILLTKSGTIGRIAIVPESPIFSLFVSVALIKPYKQIINSKYLQYALEHYINSIDIKQDIKGAVIKNFHLEDLRVANIPFCSLNEQEQIVSEIETRLSVINELEKMLDNSLIQLELFREGILTKGFNGELLKREFNTDSVFELVDQIIIEKQQFENEEILTKSISKSFNFKIKNMAEELMDVLELLKANKGGIESNVLWQSSIYKNNIDAFYAKIKKHVDEGLIEELPRKGKESILVLVENLDKINS